MRPRLHPLWILALAGLLGACDGPTSHVASPRSDAKGELHYGQIHFRACSLNAEGAVSVEAYCAKLPVAEDPDAPDGRQIELSIALVLADGMAEVDPVYMIAGGPGQSALESYPMLHEAFSDVRRSRHVVLVDARGTGGSHPLHCRIGEDDALFSDPDMETPEAARAFAQGCRESLEAIADLRHYTTGHHVRDLDTVRRKLGVEQINLVGISYGSRVAQQYAAAYPDHTRALVLDSVVPNSLVLGQEHARNLEEALEAQFARCRESDACASNLGDPHAQLALVRQRLQAGRTAPVRYRDPVSGQWREEVPRYGHLAGLLRMYAYHPAMSATLPLLLHEAGQERYEGLLAQARMLSRNLGDSMAIGMALSVTCSEDAEDFSMQQADEGTVLGGAFVTMLQAQCLVWPQGERAPDFRAPLAGDIPVLAITGEFDPVTPPRYGDDVVKNLPHGRHLVLPGQGHSVLATGCMPKLLAQFIETTDAQSLDAGCLQRLSAQPPFSGLYGWEP